MKEREESMERRKDLRWESVCLGCREKGRKLRKEGEKEGLSRRREDGWKETERQGG